MQTRVSPHPTTVDIPLFSSFSGFWFCLPWEGWGETGTPVTHTSYVAKDNLEVSVLLIPLPMHVCMGGAHTWVHVCVFHTYEKTALFSCFGKKRLHGSEMELA